MKAAEYIADATARAKRYHKDVLEGNIVRCEWIRLQAVRFENDLVDDRYLLDVEKSERVFRFFSILNIAIGDAIRQFALTDSQCWIIYFCFGLIRVDNGLRKIRRVWLFTAKKSGKTTFAAAVQLYMMCYDREPYSDSILVAGSRDQANIAYNAALEMVKGNEDLKNRFRYNETRAITYESNKNGKCRLFTRPSKDLSFDGVNVHGGILDEAHVHKHWNLAMNMTSATKSRRQPMVWFTSTAGFDMSFPFFDKVKVGERILLGELEDDISAYFFFTLDEGDDPENPDVWIKSNPNLGQTVSMEDMKDEMKLAKLSNDEWINFLVKYLNIWVNEAAQWIDDEDLKAANQGVPVEGSDEEYYHPSMDEFRENDFFIGVDLSDTTDFNVVVWLTERDGIFYAWSRYYCSKKTQLKRTGGVDVGPWLDQGFAHIFDTKKRIDTTLIADDIIKEVEEGYYVRSLQYDPYNAKEFIMKLKQEGVYCQPHMQTTGYYNEPTKALEKLIYDGRVVLDGNPFNVFHLRNVVLMTDQNNNYKPGKKDSLDCIDFACALVMALSGYLKLYNNDYYIALKSYNDNVSTEVAEVPTKEEPVVVESEKGWLD